MKPMQGDTSGCWKLGTCLRQVAPRSYLVNVDGSFYRRNRVDLRVAEPTASVTMDMNEPSHSPTPEENLTETPAPEDIARPVRPLSAASRDLGSRRFTTVVLTPKLGGCLSRLKDLIYELYILLHKKWMCFVPLRKFSSMNVDVIVSIR